MNNYNIGCNHALVPLQSPNINITTIAVFHSPAPNVTYLMVAKGNTHMHALFMLNRTDQLALVNSSFCYISSLEVYRGRVQSIEINHEEYSLTDFGTVEV